MASFFEKLKKGMGIEIKEKEEKEETEKVEEAEKTEEAEEIEEIEEKVKETPKASKKRKVKTLKIKTPRTKIETEESGPEKIETSEIKAAILPENPQKIPEKMEIKKEWPEPMGELAIDVYQTENELVIQSAIAGVKPEDLDISMERDILTIKGTRQKPFEESGDYFTQECYWGPFSREVILPVEVDPDRTEATMKDGILTIRIPKILREKKRQIKVRI